MDWSNCEMCGKEVLSSLLESGGCADCRSKIATGKFVEANCETCGKKILIQANLGNVAQSCESCNERKLKEKSEEEERLKAEHERLESSWIHLPFITLDSFGNHRKVTQVLGTARGSTVRTKHVGSDAVAGLKSVVGGE